MAFNDVDESPEAQISAKPADEVRYFHLLWGQGPPKRPFSAKNNSEKSNGRNKRFKKDRTQSDEETPAVSKSKSDWNMELNVERPKRFEDSKKRKNEETAPDIKRRKPHVTKSEWKIDAKVEWPERFQENKKQRAEETASTSYIEGKKRNASRKMEEHLEMPNGVWASVTQNWSVQKVKPRRETVQQRAVKVFRKFLAERSEDESFIEEEDDDDSDDSSDDDDGYLSKEDRVMKFFVGMFEKDAELCSYYEENCNSASFQCLVCSAIGQRIGKRYPNCASLIQHALQLRKTKRIASHRGYGRALSAILGRNANRL